MFWGLLAVAVPVILHFWHQKRGKVLPWAATQWLSEKALQQSRGIRLENILLLLLRILLLAILVLFFTKPFFKSVRKNDVKTHWVFPQKSLVDNYKFELEGAKSKGEKLFWLNGEEIKNLKEVPAKTDIQEGINRIKINGNERAEIYVSNTADLSGFSKIFIPVNFTLHILKDSSKALNPDYIQLQDGKKLTLNRQGMLAEMEASGNPLHSGNIKVLNETSESGIEASLKAIEKVYGIQFETDLSRKTDKKYDLVFSNNPDNIQAGDGVGFISNAKQLEAEKPAKNRVYLKDKLTPESSDLVFNGGLPEFFLDKLMHHLGIGANASVLSNQQIESLFAAGRVSPKAENHWLLFIVFLGILGAERWLAIKKNT